MIAYHFPPVRGSSGIQRTLKFSQYLLDHAWKAKVLTVITKAYGEIDDGQVDEIPKDVYVQRAFALDTSKHLSIKGRYIRWMALPDRWLTWCLGGVISGLWMVIRFKPKIIWSTYPIATAHLIGLILHCLTRIPWVADFRDPMTESDYPINPLQRRAYLWIERQTIKYCVRAVFTTPSAVKIYKERYPEVSESHWVLIPNGYDEENFIKAEKSTEYQKALKNKDRNKLTLLHSGILYPSERDPSQFFLAMLELLNSGTINSRNFKLVLRATGNDELYLEQIKKKGLEEVIFIEASVSYQQALAEMMVVDGLLIFQAANCNHQIPAKIYEYLRAKKPIFALTDLTGDTAAVLIDTKEPTVIAALDNKDEIIRKMTFFLQQLKQSSISTISDSYIYSQSRKARTELLAEILDDICGTI